MVPDNFDLDNVILVNEISMWLEMGRSTPERFEGVTPEQQIRSKI